MIIENSSKCYPKLCDSKNHEIDSIQVNLLGQIKVLTSKDFFERPEIVNLQNSPEMKQGLHSIIFDQKNLAILHIFLYYCIKVEEGIQLQGLDAHYLKELSNFYVEKSFKVDIGKFAQMCSNCVNIKLRKCVHMIYYLIYGRLATNSYVNTIINQLHTNYTKKDKVKTLTTNKFLSKKQNKDYRERPSKKSLALEEIMCEELIEDLKQIFHKSENKNEIENPYKSRNQDPIYKSFEQLQENQKQKEEKLNGPGSKSQKKYYMSFFPNRVYNEQKSAIFERILPSHKNNYRLMRKKKFDDSKIQKILYQTFNTDYHPEVSSQNITNDLSSSVNKERNKIFTHNAVKTNERFKNSSLQLDKIRNIISSSKAKKKTILAVQQNPNVTQSQKEYLELMKKKSNKNDGQQRHEMHDISNYQYDNENKFTSLTRKQQKLGHRVKKDSDYQCQKSKCAIKMLNNFSTAGCNNSGNKTMFYTECQNRVYQYKNEYRRFMKLHLFRAEDDVQDRIF